MESSDSILCADVDRLLGVPATAVTADTLEQVLPHLGECPGCQRRLFASSDENVRDLVLRACVGAALPEEDEAVARVAGLAFAEARKSGVIPPLLNETGEHSNEQTPAEGSREGTLDAFQPPVPLKIGKYEILDELGAGGMGRVYKAHDPNLDRPVALKILHPHLASSRHCCERFLREGKAVAAVKHPHVIGVHDADRAEDGTLFLAMEYLEGRSLEEELQERGALPVAEVIAIARQTAEGLAAAHARGLIHRDLKPGNLFLADNEDGSSWSVRILDFGLVRDERQGSNLTRPDAVMGTPGYMSPEQAQASSLDHRTDLFSLGCLLYRVTTGAEAFPGLTEVQRIAIILSHEPLPPEEARPDLPPQLASLIRQLLRKDPAERPATALAVIQFLDALQKPPAVPLPVATPQPSARRWPVLLAFGLIVCLAIAVAVAFTFRTRHGTLIVTVPNDLALVEVYIDEERKVIVSSKELGRIQLVPGPHKVTVWLPGAKAPFQTESFEIVSGQDRPIKVTYLPREEPRPNTIPAEERKHAGGADAPAELVAVLGSGRYRHWGSVTAVAVTPDGKTLVSGDAAGEVRCWSLDTGELIASTRRPHEVQSLAIHPNGKTVAIGAKNSGVELFTWEQGKTDLGGGGTYVAFSPDGRTRIESVGTQVTLHDGLSKPVRRPLAGHTADVVRLSYAHSGEVFATTGYDKTIRVWKADGTPLIRIQAEGVVWFMAISPDGGQVYFSDGPALRVWDVARNQEVKARRVEGGGGGGLVCTNDGKFLVLFRMPEGVVAFRSLDTWEKEHHLAVGSDVTALALTQSGRRVVTGHRSGLVRIWDTSSGEELFVRPDGIDLQLPITLSPDGRMAAGAARDGSVRLWDITHGKPVRTLFTPRGVDQLRFSQDGKLLAGQRVFPTPTVTVWAVADGKQEQSFPVPTNFGTIQDLAFRADGRALAVTGFDKAGVWLFDQADQPRTFDVSASGGSIAFTPAGQVGVLQRNGWFRIFNVATGKVDHEWPEKRSGWLFFKKAMRLSADGTGLLTGSNEKNLQAFLNWWDINRSALRFSVPAGMNAIGAVALSADERLLAAGSSLEGPAERGSIRVWRLKADSDKPEVWKTLPLAGREVLQLEFTPDGTHLLSVNGNGTIYVFRLAP